MIERFWGMQISQTEDGYHSSPLLSDLIEELMSSWSPGIGINTSPGTQNSELGGSEGSVGEQHSPNPV